MITDDTYRIIIDYEFQIINDLIVDYFSTNKWNILVKNRFYKRKCKRIFKQSADTLKKVYQMRLYCFIIFFHETLKKI